jgi:dolichyl-phosphate beta-glucosyltransferase
MGRTYNRILKVLNLTDFVDTQCGFKAFTASATACVFPRQTVERFSFDVELLYIAAKHGLNIRELPVRWINSRASRVSPVRDSARMFWDLILIHYRDSQGRYR